MFRLLGFLIGSVTAITIILLVLGIPEFNLTDPGNDQQRFDAAVEKLKEKQRKRGPELGRLFLRATEWQSLLGPWQKGAPLSRGCRC